MKEYSNGVIFPQNFLFDRIPILPFIACSPVSATKMKLPCSCGDSPLFRLGRQKWKLFMIKLI